MNPGKSPFSVGIKPSKGGNEFPRWLKIFAKMIWHSMLAMMLVALLFLVGGASGWICRWVVSWFA